MGTPRARARVRHIELSTIKTEYERHLTRERGLSVATQAGYWWRVARFLVGVAGKRGVALHRLGLDQISRFILREAARTPGRTIQTVTSALRSFLRFLFLRGWIAADLVGAVPTVPDRRGGVLPRYLPADQVEQLLRSCDLRTPIGRRDHAILRIRSAPSR